MPHSNIGQLISVIFTVSRLMREHATDQEKIDPFTFLQLETLRYIDEKSDPFMKGIADYLWITPPSATSLINGLVKTRQLERVYDKDDRRMIRLIITAKGKKTLNAGFKKKIKFMKKMFDKLSEKEIDDLIKIFEKFSRAYSK